MAFLPPSQPNPDPLRPHVGVMGVKDSTSERQEETPEATLLVRHLPEAISGDTLSRFFSHYGASSVRPCAGGRLRNCVFVDFKKEASALQAQSQLNRLRFLGKVLSVERAGGQIPCKEKLLSEGKLGKNSTPPASSVNNAQVTGSISKVSIACSIPISEPIAPKLGVEYPFSPHLKYAYPPPDGNILTNIVNALIAVPRFYTQVLHLMNKMNIPAPFRMALPTPPLPPPVPPPPPPPQSPPPPPPPPAKATFNRKDLSSDESELEFSDEGDAAEESRAHKRAKREAIVGPAIDKGVAHEAVGLRPSTLVPKEIPLIKKKHPVLQIRIASKPVQGETMSEELGIKGQDEQQNEGLEVIQYANRQEIENGKLPPEEILSLPMFKNYTSGNPAKVLYIKNLAKDVSVDDFYFIFGSFFGSIEAARNALNVKLMQEGRMRGQAFVTFPSVDLAQNALNLVNGYVFKGKPMIIQFGRNPAATGKAS
ncbi:U11/U12 small nuclear ribonucleoprotein 65 kDa protein [Aristolochia californica]|uniref:U11/U12 small nuclear ribonucleoprotein 65 kDa protein n=1 Tax=Aristolochia californica TaxID=171875 RepID=UPI0035D71DFE